MIEKLVAILIYLSITRKVYKLICNIINIIIKMIRNFMNNKWCKTQAKVRSNVQHKVLKKNRL